MQKYRFDREGDICPNGSQPVYTLWMGGPSLAGVRNCPVEGADLARTVYVTHAPDTYFSQPAICKIAGKRAKGFLTSNETGYLFTPSRA